MTERKRRTRLELAVDTIGDLPMDRMKDLAETLNAKYPMAAKFLMTSLLDAGIEQDWYEQAVLRQQQEQDE